MTRVKIFLWGILLLVFAALLGWSIYRGVPAASVRGFMDFPCHVDYDPRNECIVTYAPSNLGHNEGIQIETFLTTHQAGFYGGGCDHETSNTEILELSTFLGEFSLQRVGEVLKVDSAIVAKGQGMTRTVYTNLDPWVISHINLKNLGVVADCVEGSTHTRLVVAGSYGTELSIAKGALISLLGLVGLVTSGMRLTRLRAKEARRKRRQARNR